MSGAIQAGCRPESRELLIEIEFPGQRVVPAVRSFRYLKGKHEIQPEPVKDTEIKKSYARLIARIVLRTLAEAFDVAPGTLVTGIALNGYVSSKDRATGKPIRPLLISVNAIREAFEELVLDEPELDPEMCLRGFLNAIVSPTPTISNRSARCCSSTCPSTSSSTMSTSWPAWTAAPTWSRSSPWSSNT